MPEWASTLIVAVVLLLLLLGGWAAWRSRTRRDAGLVPSHAVPAQPGAVIVTARALYVATTKHGEPLERLAIRGLGFRAQGALAVHDSGVLLSLDGSEDVWIPASDLIDAEPATVVIDKAVERDGLLAVSWRIGAVPVSSYFRVFEPEKSGAIYDAIDSIAPSESEA